MSASSAGWQGAFTFLLLLGIAGVIASIPVALATALWLPVAWQQGPAPIAVSAAIITAPAVQIGILARASDWNREGREGPAKVLIAAQLLIIVLIAGWMINS